MLGFSECVVVRRGYLLLCRFALEHALVYFAMSQFCHLDLHIIFFFLFLVAWISPKVFVAEIPFEL